MDRIRRIRVGIKDIASKANVSTATVSYVLNGTRNVSPKTRERVQRVIDELNYKPNAIAQSLKNQRTKTIGVIAEDVTVFNVPEIIDGINDYADRREYQILLTNLRLNKKIGRQYDQIDRYRKLLDDAVSELTSKQVEGIIYIGVHPRDMSGLMNPLVPMVFTYCYSQTNTSILYDDEGASYEAMSYLVGKGHRRIAIISGKMDSLPSRMRFNGFYKAVTNYELPFDPGLIKLGDWEAESGYRLAKELLSLTDPPSAIIAMNDVMAVGVLRAAAEVGVAIPSDLSIVGFDNREFSEYLNPRITTMELPLHEMGYLAMESLLSTIQGQDVELRKNVLCTLVERDSVAPVSIEEGGTHADL